jgi:hypothetical protein
VPTRDGGNDRLATVPAALSDARRERAWAGALNQYVRRVSDRQPACVRLESSRASAYWRVTADGLLPVGHRPDLPQVKSMVAALEPLGMPAATDVGPGQRAAAPLDIPAVIRGRASLGRPGRLEGGDGNMAALATRALRHVGGDTDRCPLWRPRCRPPSWPTTWRRSGRRRTS